MGFSCFLFFGMFLLLICVGWLFLWFVKVFWVCFPFFCGDMFYVEGLCLEFCLGGGVLAVFLLWGTDFRVVDNWGTDFVCLFLVGFLACL